MIQELEQKLLHEAGEYIKEEGISIISSSIEYARKFSDGIKDFKGNSYYAHILRTTIILVELHADAITIASSMVQWIPFQIESVSCDEIREEFGDEIGNITESLCKINTLKLKDNAEASAIYFRKVLVGLSTDVRVIIIKLANRLDNLREVYTEPSEEQKNKCIETESVLIPIAHRLGINYIKSELEDLCLKYLKPDIYKEILENLDSDYEELQSYIDEMKSTLSDLMNEHYIKFHIKGRVKSVHSLYTKLAKGKRWSEIYDILALRIIVEKESECYLAIGLIHAKYRPIPKRFKDYIAQPKENMYQSLHTGVIGPNGKVFEIQIRTEEMDEIAECGIASHWSYKEHGTKAIQKLMEQKLELFRESLTIVNTDDAAIDEFKETFLSNMIYVFTPKGDILELPEGATPVDFAYRIHSHVGDTMTGAIVNDQIVPVDKQLQNNDIVKIMTNENSTPNKEWLNFVKTGQAKNKIKAYFNKQDREEYIAKGEELLIREIRRSHLNMNETLSEENIAKLTNILKLESYEELKLCIGSLRYTAKYVLSLLNEEKQNISDLILEKITSSTRETKPPKNDIIVEGCDNVLISTANCCKPVYGDDIIGYITKGEGIVVHKADCINIKNMDSRFIEVKWNEIQDDIYTTGLHIHGNRVGNNVLDIVTKSASRELKITAIDTMNHETHTDYHVLVQVPNKESLRLFMLDLESLPFVNSVEREMK